MARVMLLKPQEVDRYSKFVEVFSQFSGVQEEKYRKYFTPGAPALIDISRQFYSYGLMESDLLVPEYIDYYFTSLLWMRFVSLKHRALQFLNETETTFLEMTQNCQFCIPEPLFLALRVYGVVKTMIGEALTPDFPYLPEYSINNIGGHYGPMNTETHTLYEEIPCLGVVAYGVINSISDLPPGKYDSLVTFEGVQPNHNLLGYKPLNYRKPNAKNTAINAGFTNSGMKETLPGTGFNMDLVQSISNILGAKSLFKIHEMCMMDLPLYGSQSLTVIARPLPTDGCEHSALLTDIQPTCVCKVSDEIFAAGVFFCTELMKNEREENLLTWSIFPKIPKEWIRNRNCRRNLPRYYYETVFSSNSVCASSLRINVISKLDRTR